MTSFKLKGGNYMDFNFPDINGYVIIDDEEIINKYTEEIFMNERFDAYLLESITKCIVDNKDSTIVIHNRYVINEDKISITKFILEPHRKINSIRFIVYGDDLDYDDIRMDYGIKVLFDIFKTLMIERYKMEINEYFKERKKR